MVTVWFAHCELWLSFLQSLHTTAKIHILKSQFCFEEGCAVSYRVRHSILSSLKLIVVDSWWGFGVAGWGWEWYRGWRGWGHSHSSHAGLGRRHHCHDPHPGLYTKSTCVQRSNSISVHGQGLFRSHIATAISSPPPFLRFYSVSRITRRGRGKKRLLAF